MITQRFNIDWKNGEPNPYFFGLVDVVRKVYEHNYELKKSWPPPKLKMLEIGCYMGESTFIFGASDVFLEIHCIDPFEGHEKFNLENDYDWNFVQEQFKINTRFFNTINLHKNYSHKVINKFDDEYFNFIYIDASHRYDDVKRDIQMFLPKLKKNGIMAGHDYHEEKWPGVTKAVNEVFEKPDEVHWDTSWIKYV